jgi:hypothetical protein
MNPPPSDCGKDGHTYDGARHVIKKMMMKARKQGRTVRKQEIYKCPWCGLFHTTSHSYNISNPKREAAHG